MYCLLYSRKWSDSEKLLIGQQCKNGPHWLFGGVADGQQIVQIRK